MLDQFIQSRIDYVIENTLGYVELDIFLDHMNEKNKNTKIHELNDLFESIFNEKKSEFTTVSYAYLSAKKITLSAYLDSVRSHSKGTLYRDAMCKICQVNIDQEIR